MGSFDFGSMYSDGFCGANGYEKSEREAVGFALGDREEVGVDNLGKPALNSCGDLKDDDDDDERLSTGVAKKKMKKEK